MNIDWSLLTLKEKLALGRKKKILRSRGDGYTVRLVYESPNRKTGPMPVSMTDMGSCPPSCPLRNMGCYAEHGHVAMHWQRVPKIGEPWSVFCVRVAALPPERLWRHNEAGDLLGVGDTLDIEALRELVEANRGRRGFTFTHRPLRTLAEREAIAWANKNGFVINLSTEDLGEADRLAELGVGPVTVLLPPNAPDQLATPAGRKVIVCLNDTKGLTCKDCQLCAKQRTAIVGFRAHGSARGIAGLLTLHRKKVAP